MTRDDRDSMDASAIRVDQSCPGRYKETPLQERGRGWLRQHPAPPMNATEAPVTPMFPVSILATLACARTPDFCPEVPPIT